jgi:hypothetical protein
MLSVIYVVFKLLRVLIVVMLSVVILSVVMLGAIFWLN